MMGPMISVVMPVHNEERILERNLGRLLDYMASLGTGFDIVLVENGSTDATFEIAKRLSEKDPRIKALSIKQKSLGDALRKGILEADGDILIWYPIDLSVGLSYIPESLSYMEKHDLVIGSKEHKDSRVERSGTRKAYSKVYNSLVNMLFGLGLSDTQCVKTFRKQSIASLAKQAKSGGIVFEVELLYLAKKKRLKIKELPVTVKDIRKDSKIKIGDIIKAFINLITLRMRV